MSEIVTIARPYAKAIFEVAREQGRLAPWSQALHTLAIIAADKEMQLLLSNPLISRKKLADLFVNISGNNLDENSVRLIALLAEKNRLNLLPAIAALYKVMVAEHEKTLEVKVVSAYPIDQTRLQRLQHALQNKLKYHVIMQCEVDKALIGGAIIYAGDQKIDGSLQCKLKKLSERLCS